VPRKEVTTVPPLPSRSSYDAIVVGARCAGAATARLLARRGLKVLAVERSRRGSDTVSTHALMRGGVLQLHRWGLLDVLVAAGTPPVRRTCFHYADETVEVAIKPRDGVDALYSPRRTLLDTVLADAAAAAGAEVVHGVAVRDLVRDPGGRVRGVVLETAFGARELAADLVIGADGLRSTVARLVEAPVERAAIHATGVVYAYWKGLGLDGNHWHYAPGVGIGAIPTNDGDTCVFAGTTSARYAAEVRRDIETGYHRLLAEVSPELAGRVAGTARSGGYRAFAGVPGFLRRSWGPGWALVGDAAYFKDPITAHGMTDALRDAQLLADAVGIGTEAALADYQRRRDDLSGAFFAATDRVASFAWDLDELKRVHLEMSREMARESEAIAGMDAQPAPRPHAAGDPAATAEAR